MPIASDACSPWITSACLAIAPALTVTSNPPCLPTHTCTACRVNVISAGLMIAMGVGVGCGIGWKGAAQGGGKSAAGAGSRSV